jgi:transmembrane 9 superfamily member 2/4
LERYPWSNSYSYGSPVGFVDASRYTLYNHWKFIVTTRTIYQGVYITGFDVIPMSIQHNITQSGSTCNADDASTRQFELTAHTTLTISYEVEWISAPMPWKDRWDVFVVADVEDRLHNTNIVRSLLLVAFLSWVVDRWVIVPLREESHLKTTPQPLDWRQLHGDVFRPPSWYPMALCVCVCVCVCVGTGAQLTIALLLLFLSIHWQLCNPIETGYLLTAWIVLYVVCGVVAGFTSSYLNKCMKNVPNHETRSTVMTALAVPGCCFAAFCILNYYLSTMGAATAMSASTILVLLALCWCVLVPLVVCGSWITQQVHVLHMPCNSDDRTRAIPTPPWYLTPYATFAWGGIVLFSGVYFECVLALNALWLRPQFSYAMGY